jgi:hypothetical protein
MVAPSSHTTQHALKQRFANYYLRLVKILNAMD